MVRTLNAVLLALLTLGLAACADFQQDLLQAYPENGPEIVIEVQGKNGDGQLVYAVNMQKAWIAYPFIRVAEKDAYNGIYIQRAIPGLLVESEDGRWHNRDIPAVTPRVTPQEGRERATQARGSGEIGLILENGMVGPRLVLMRGRTYWESYLLPESESFGKLVSGKEVLDRLVKGDKIVSVYGRKFPVGPDPY